MKSIFHEPSDVSFSEMNAISFALFKEATRELDADEFFEITQFYMPRIENDSIDENSLVSFKLFLFIYIFLILCRHLHFFDTMFMLFW